MRKSIFSFVLLTFVLYFCHFGSSDSFSNTASANGGPQKIYPQGHGPLQFDLDSGIRLEEEEVKFLLPSLHPEPDDNSHEGQAEVVIRYKLSNQRNEPVHATILFVTPRIHIEQFSVMEDTTGNEKHADMIPSWYMNPTLKDWRPGAQTFFEPVSGEPLSYSNYSELVPETQGASFDLSFQPEESKWLVLRYLDPGGRYEAGLISPVHSYVYFLTPALSWEGDTQIRLSIELPEKNAAVHSNLPLTRVTDTEYVWTDSSIPSEEWSFTAVSTKHLFWGTNGYSNHWNRTLLSVGVVHLLLLFLSLYFSSAMQRTNVRRKPRTSMVLTFTAYLLPVIWSGIHVFLILPSLDVWDWMLAGFKILLYYLVVGIIHLIMKKNITKVMQSKNPATL